MEDQKEPMEPRNGSSSSTQDPEESVGEEKDIPTEADLPQEKQEEVSLSSTQNKEEKVTEEIQADLEVNEPQAENKQEEEDKVDTFFSTMSHRYEAPPLLWSSEGTRWMYCTHLRYSESCFWFEN